MDGRLLVLCEEHVTLNSYNKRVDKDGNILRKIEDGSYQDKDLKKVEVDEHKNVVSAIDLILPVEPENIEKRDILFVDWKTVVPEDVEYLQKLISYSMTKEQLPLEIIQEGLKQKDSLMKRAHEEVFYMIQNERPRTDYKFLAMDRFMENLYNMIQEKGIVSVLPAYSKETDSAIKMARHKIMEAFRERNQTLRKNKINFLQLLEYENFGEVYIRAQNEMLEILSMPDWYDALSSGIGIGE